MPNSLQSSAIASPASRRATNCSLSSIAEHSFQGIAPSPLRGESVTYVSGTMCYPCLRSLTILYDYSFSWPSCTVAESVGTRVCDDCVPAALLFVVAACPITTIHASSRRDRDRAGDPLLANSEIGVGAGEEA